MEISIVNRAARLLTAHTETELFIHLCALLQSAHDHDFHVTLGSVWENDQAALRIAIEQPMRQYTDSQIILLWKTTHVFTLSEAGSLNWQRPNGQVITGLVNIQMALQHIDDNAIEPLQTLLA